MPGPRKPETIRVQPDRRQVFQWHFREKLPLRILKQKMDQLSLELVELTGEDFIAPESLWEDRIGYWNKRSLERWNIEKSQRGPDLPVPANIVNVPFWRAWDADVKEWAAWKNSHESNYNILNTPRNPSITVSDVSYNLNQAPARSHSAWTAQELGAVGTIPFLHEVQLITNTSSNSSEGGASRVPSLFSEASRSTGTFSHESLPLYPYSQDPAFDNSESISWHNTMSDPMMNLCPPQFPNPGSYNNQQVFCDEGLSAMTPAKVPETHQAGFGYEAWQNTTLPMDYPGMSYNNPDSHDPALLMARPPQADQRLLYMPPEQEGVVPQSVKHDHNAHLNNTMAPPSFNPLSATSTLLLPPRFTVHHTIHLYGEEVPWEEL